MRLLICRDDRMLRARLPLRCGGRSTMETEDQGALSRSRKSWFRMPQDRDYIPHGHIPAVIRNRRRNLWDGCYSLSDILDLAANHLVYTGEAQAVEQQLRAGVTVREFLRVRYGVACGPSERGDRYDLNRFRLWLADTRWRIRKMRAQERVRRAVELRRTWSARTPAMVM